MKEKKITKIEPYSDIYYRRLNQVARDFCPRIYPCKKCGSPVADGYCCTYCGDNDPSTEEKEA